jgi:hypothetical protein
MLLFAMVVVLGGCCCQDEPVTTGPDETVITDPVESRYVVVIPLAESDKCVVYPFERVLDNNLKHVTFLNLTVHEVGLGFPTNLIEEGDVHTLGSEEAVTLTLKEPLTAGTKFEYSVKADCYVPVLPGPFIVLP